MTKTDEGIIIVLEGFRQQGQRIVLCLGCFDLLHPGHLRHFRAAKRMGDILVVAVTSDRYVNKGSSRPVFNQDLRVEMVSALMCVDLAFVNDFPTGVEAIRALRPDVFVKGQEFESGEDPTGRFQKEVAAAKGVKKKCPACEKLIYLKKGEKKDIFVALVDGLYQFGSIPCSSCNGTNEVGCEVRFTHEMVFSSTKLIEEIKKEE